MRLLNLIRTYGVFVALAAVPTDLVFGAEGVPDSHPVVRVISYNVQFLPPPADIANKRPNAPYRAARIAKEVSAFDIVGLQEVFHPRYRKQIISGVESAWNTPPNVMVAPKPNGFLANGGCMLLTHRQLLSTNAVVFKNFSKPADYGLRADGHAAKGVIHSRISLDDSDSTSSIDVFVTHLEARADELRPRQYVELAEFVKKKSDPRRPMILMGDMNTNGLIEHRTDPTSQYQRMMAQLGKARPAGRFTDIWAEMHARERGGTSEQESTDVGKRIDYIFVCNPPAAEPQLRPTSITVELFKDETVTALSDHNAVIAELRWSPGGATASK